jgi:hypothetical protein
MSRPSSQDNKPFIVSIPPVAVLRLSYAFRTQECFNLARDDVSRLRRTRLLAFWLAGRLVEFSCGVASWNSVFGVEESGVCGPVLRRCGSENCRCEWESIRVAIC